MEQERVDFGLRLGAYILDLIFAAIFMFVFSGLLGSIFGASGSLAGSGAGSGTLATSAAGSAFGGILGGFMGFLLGFIFAVPVYYGIELFTGYTLAKFILKIWVRDEQGNKPDFTRAFIRWAIKNSFIVLPSIGFIMAYNGIDGKIFVDIGGYSYWVFFIGAFLALGQKKQALHDLAGKTAVYKKVK